MGRFICALAAALLISAVSLLGQAQPGTERITPQAQAAAKNLMQDVQTVGCIRLWKPASGDPTRMPPDRQPGLAGIYLLTPFSSSAAAAADNVVRMGTPCCVADLRMTGSSE